MHLTEMKLGDVELDIRNLIAKRAIEGVNKKALARLVYTLSLEDLLMMLEVFAGKKIKFNSLVLTKTIIADTINYHKYTNDVTLQDLVQEDALGRGVQAIKKGIDRVRKEVEGNE